MSGPVEEGPPVAASAVSLRAPEPLPAAAGRNLRVMSYNILADQYAGSTFAQQVRFRTEEERREGGPGKGLDFRVKDLPGRPGWEQNNRKSAKRAGLKL